MLLRLNERGRWSDPPPADEAKRALQDEEIFQIARMVKCVDTFRITFATVADTEFAAAETSWR